MLSRPSHRDLAQSLGRIAGQAGELLLEYHDRPHQPRKKKDGSVVTPADLASHSLIARQIAILCPGVPIISEESEGTYDPPTTSPNRFFLLDPLDGTSDFIKKTGNFTINIALIENQQPTMGILYAPFHRRLFCGYRDDLGQTHAWEEDGNGHLVPLDPARACSDHSGHEITVVTGPCRPVDPKKVSRILGRHQPIRVLRIGSALKFGLLASGEADLCLCDGPTMEWDSAAGHAILECAGGATTLLDGNPLLYGKFGSGLRNPGFVASRAKRLGKGGGI